MAERAGPLIAVVFVQGAGRDPAVRAFVDRIERERAIGTAGVAGHLARRADRSRGRRRGWSLDRYQRWLATTMAEALLRRP